MIAYLDTSALVRIVLGQAGALREWRQLERVVTSAVTEVELLRAVARYAVEEQWSDAETSRVRALAYDHLAAFSTVTLAPPVLVDAAAMHGSALRSLDAIHVASAERARAELPELQLFATHDRGQARAARARGFEVLGWPPRN